MNKQSKQTVLVTGGRGFIGQYLVKALKERDIDVYSLSHQVLYDLPLLMTTIQNVNPTYIFALHAYGNMAHQQEEDQIIMANYFATWNLLKATSFMNYKSLIYVSSSSVLLPHETFYSASKAGAERLCQAYATQYKKPIGIVRPFSVYGPCEAPFRFIPTVFRSCMIGEPMVLAPDAIHDWLYIDDIVNSILNISDNIASNGKADEIYNIGTGIGTFNRDVVSLIEKITGKKANITERKQLRAFDNQQWIAKVRGQTLSLPEGLERIWQTLQIKI